MKPFPHSAEVERSLLGGLIQNPTRLRDVMEYLKADDFHRPEHKRLYTLLLDLDANAAPIDVVTVTERMSREGKADRYGGISYVTSLVDGVPPMVNLDHYARLVHDKALLRSFIEQAQGLVDRAFDAPDDVGRLLDDAGKMVNDIGRHQVGRRWERISKLIDDQVVLLQKLAEKPTGVTGVTTGFPELDEKLSGLQKGDLVILAARPSMGKTALALNMAASAALIDHVAVGVFSLEMGQEQLVARMLSSQAMVDAKRMRTGRLEEDDRLRLEEASELLRRARIHIDDSPGLTVAEIRARARKLLAQEADLGLLVVDYLQLMQSEDPAASRTQQVSDMSRGLKALAKEMKLPVLALSQLNRSVDQRADKRPMLSDLRESGAIEQDADVILFIYRDEVYNRDTTQDRGLAEVIVAKQRNGPTGTVKLLFEGQYTRFDNVATGDLDL